MKNETLTLLLISAGALALVIPGVWLAIRSWRSHKLRQKFGSEYDYTLEKVGDQREAEETLEQREKRVTKLEIRALYETEKERYLEDWMNIQANFVDDPSKSVREANRLIPEIMIVRGFPVADFEQRAADLSVIAPDSVSDYRGANAIVVKNQRGEASTEELRQAMVYFHTLFEELLGIATIQDDAAAEKEASVL